MIYPYLYLKIIYFPMKFSILFKTIISIFLGLFISFKKTLAYS